MDCHICRFSNHVLFKRAVCCLLSAVSVSDVTVIGPFIFSLGSSAVAQAEKIRKKILTVKSSLDIVQYPHFLLIVVSLQAFAFKIEPLAFDRYFTLGFKYSSSAVNEGLTRCDDVILVTCCITPSIETFFVSML